MFLLPLPEILKSDATFHAKKDGSDDYCPPLEQIRWWRVICDESQSLKQSNTQKSMAVMNLVGDMKWLVSGKNHWAFACPSSVDHACWSHYNGTNDMNRDAAVYFGN